MDEATKLLSELVGALNRTETPVNLAWWQQLAEATDRARAYLQAPAAEAPTPRCADCGCAEFICNCCSAPLARSAP